MLYFCGVLPREDETREDKTRRYDQTREERTKQDKAQPRQRQDQEISQKPKERWFPQRTTMGFEDINKTKANSTTQTRLRLIL